jgi:chloramphenicol 3-O-phosphotransferase
VKKIILIFTAIAVIIFAYLIYKQKPGRVIVLDGTSTSGKTSIVKHLMPMLGTSYKKVAIDDFVTEVFLEQEKLQRSEKEFLKRIHERSEDMYDTIRKLVNSGENVLVDTVISGLEGEKDREHFFKELKGLNVLLVLVYCPLNVLAERINKRNEKALKENNSKDTRSRSVALVFDDMYKTQESDNEVILGQLSRKDIELAYSNPKNELGETAKAFKQIKQNLISHFKLENKKVVNITSQLVYDCVVDTSKNNPEECAQQIKNCLKTYNTEAFIKNI